MTLILKREEVRAMDTKTATREELVAEVGQLRQAIEAYRLGALMARGTLDSVDELVARPFVGDGEALRPAS